MNNSTVQQLRDHMQQGGDALLIDVRSPGEFAQRHVDGFQNMPLHDLQAGSLATAGDDREIWVMCQSGSRAETAARKIESSSGATATVVQGGISAWEKAGYDLVRGTGGMSMERQVRLAAGLLVLLGIGLGMWVHPGFFALSAFVGAGLAYAGITDTCGMAMLLARAPWNR